MDDEIVIFDELYEEYHDDIYRYALAHTSEPDTAENITATAFTRLWLHWNSKQLYKNKPVQNKVWLIKAVSYLVKENYREKMRVGARDISDIENLLAGEDNISQKIEELHLEYHVKEIRKSIKPNEIELFDMLLQGKSYTEMSRELGIKESTLRSKISRMRARLKKQKEKLKNTEKI